MKWGRKKSPSPSTHCQSLITRVFPVSWLVKFKQNGVSFEPNSAQKKQKSKLNSPSSRSYQCANWKEGRFCNMEDDDVYWKLLFEEERIKARKSSPGMNSVQYYSDDELGFPTENNQQFNDMALHTRKMKEIQHEMRNMWENHASRKKKATYKTPRRKARKDRKSKNLEAKREENERGSDEEKSDENDIYEIAMESGVVHMEEKDFVKPAAFNSRKQHGFFCPRPSSSARKFVEECTSDDLNLEESNANSQEDHFSMDRQLQCEDKKIKDYLISRMEPRRKSAYISRTKQKVKVYSPRTECKIRGLEDIKKARMKSKKKTRERGAGVEGSRVFDNFAVVKCSFAPERDFRDSMVEMIREKGIRRPDELEDLLACYLTLNCDKYHDLIVKAFQQVWLFELNQEFINLEIGKDHLSSDK